MIYDTSSKWTALNTADTVNQGVARSRYNPDQSESDQPIYESNELKVPQEMSLNIGSSVLMGEKWEDNMCLKQAKKDRTLASGKICVRHQPFLKVNSIIGTFEADGILGLGPSPDENDQTSFINNLYYQGIILLRRVGLNFEDPTDDNSVSQITFGFFDYNQVQYGEDGLNYYKNIGEDHWAILMDDVRYDHQDIQSTVGGKVAIIDSSNKTIQIPASEFKTLKEYMKT